MANSKQLRNNVNQHHPKNKHSKKDDKIIYLAMQQTIHYLYQRFSEYLHNFDIFFEQNLSFQFMIDMIKKSQIRSNFEINFLNRSIKPDGGVIVLVNKIDQSKKIILISEVKRQGTNDKRLKEGKPIQAQGNAIERLGKNLTGIKAMLNYEKITPFVCFGWGCDFKSNYDSDSFVMSKISMLNEFYPLNKIYVYKQDGISGKNSFSPVSMFFREEEWTQDEMFNILKEVAETALRYYLF